MNQADLQALSDAARKARAFHEMTQIGGPWAPCGGEFGVPLECLCYEMVSDIETAFAASPSPDTDREDDEVIPVELAAWFNDRASAIRDVAAHRASPPEYPGMALVPVPDLDWLARYVDLPRSKLPSPDTDRESLRERVFSIMHDESCDEGEPHSWTEHLPWDEPNDEAASNRLADRLIAGLRPSPDTDAGLDGAWSRAVEAALPDGWAINLLWGTVTDERWGANAGPWPSKPGDPQVFAGGDTPAAALRNLAARLATPDKDQPTDEQRRAHDAEYPDHAATTSLSCPGCKALR